MKDYIERYVYDVARRLPEKNREEVKKELKANIYDMLSDNPDDEEIKKVLTDLGAPRKLAANYREKQRYLISPEYMDDYLFVLKIVVIIVGIVTFVVSFITGAFANASSISVEDVFIQLFTAIGSSIDGMLGSFAAVTLVFVIIENLAKKEIRDFAWSVEKLPRIPDNRETTIKRKDVISSLVVTIIFGTLFIYVLFKNQYIIGWFDNQGQWHMVEPVFNDSFIKLMIPFFIFSLVLDIVSILVRLRTLSWNIPAKAFYTLAKVFSVVIWIIFINSPNLLNPEFINKTAELFSMSVSTLKDNLQLAFLVASIVIPVLVMLDLMRKWFSELKKLTDKA